MWNAHSSHQNLSRANDVEKQQSRYGFRLKMRPETTARAAGSFNTMQLVYFSPLICLHDLSLSYLFYLLAKHWYKAFCLFISRSLILGLPLHFLSFIFVFSLRVSGHLMGIGACLNGDMYSVYLLVDCPLCTDSFSITVSPEHGILPTT